MPQASEELRQKIIERFGTISDVGPWRYLKTKGYTEKYFIIRPPQEDYKILSDEAECIDFLCDEWDWDFMP